MIKKIAIVGAGGRMGSWFSRYFVRKGRILKLYDINTLSPKHCANTIICDDIVSCVDKADLVMVCVPISRTPNIIRECAARMKSGAILAEISSIKNRSYKELKRIPNHVKPLCIHPMFGPAAPTVNPMKIILIPVRNGSNELRILKELFHHAVVRIIPDANTHDHIMSVILGVTYFVNLVFATYISKQENCQSLKQFAGTTFRIQSLLCTSILQDEPDLILALLSQNLTVRKQIRKYLFEARKLGKLFSGHNKPKMKLTLEKLKSLYQEREDLESSYTNMYRIISLLDKSDSDLN